jgi:O-antigen/teichoic acid export membrane protein
MTAPPPLAQQAGTALLWRAVQHVGVKGIFLVRLVILARLLSPEDFGLLAICMVAIDVLMRVTDFGMIPALVQRSEADDRHYNAAWTVGIVRALTIAVVVVLAAPFVAQVFREPRAAVILQVLAIRPLLEAAASIKVAELTRNLRFRSLTFLKVPEGVANTIIAIALAPSLGVWALVAGSLAGPTAYLVISYFLAPYHPRLYLNPGATRSLIHYGRWIFLTGLITVAGSSMLRVVISRQLGAAELGLYFLAARLAFLPAEVASAVVGEVTFPLYSRLQSNVRQTARAFQAVIIGMFALLFPICALMIALAPSLVQEVLGPRWEGTVPIIRLLVFVSIMGVVGEAVIPILKGIGQPYKVAVLEGLQSLFLIVCILEFTGRFGIVGAALAWVPAVAASQIVSCAFVQQILPRPFVGLGVPMLVIAVASGAGALVALGIDDISSGLSGFLMANLLAVVIIGTVLWVLNRRFALRLADDLSKAFPQMAAFVGHAPTDR